MLKVLRALKASMKEIMTTPIEPIFERAAKDFEIPGAKDIRLLAAQRSRRSPTTGWPTASRKRCSCNLPDRWQSGCDALRTVGFADVKDPTVLYTNSFLDKL